MNGATDIRNTLTLFPSGTNAALKVSGSTFAINNAGKVTFISGQTFPGTGTITGVKAGSGLTGGGTSGNVTLSMTNTCSSGQILQWNGTKWVCSNAGTGTITGVTAQAPITGGGSSGNVNDRPDQFLLQRTGAAVERQLVGLLLRGQRDHHRCDGGNRPDGRWQQRECHFESGYDQGSAVGREQHVYRVGAASSTTP